MRCFGSRHGSRPAASGHGKPCRGSLRALACAAQAAPDLRCQQKASTRLVGDDMRVRRRSDWRGRSRTRAQPNGRSRDALPAVHRVVRLPWPFGRGSSARYSSLEGGRAEEWEGRASCARAEHRALPHRGGHRALGDVVRPCARAWHCDLDPSAFATTCRLLGRGRRRMLLLSERSRAAQRAAGRARTSSCGPAGRRRRLAQLPGQWRLRSPWAEAERLGGRGDEVGFRGIGERWKSDRPLLPRGEVPNVTDRLLNSRSMPGTPREASPPQLAPLYDVGGDPALQALVRPEPAVPAVHDTAIGSATSSSTSCRKKF